MSQQRVWERDVLVSAACVVEDDSHNRREADKGQEDEQYGGREVDEGREDGGRGRRGLGEECDGHGGLEMIQLQWHEIRSTPGDCDGWEEGADKDGCDMPRRHSNFEIDIISEGDDPPTPHPSGTFVATANSGTIVPGSGAEFAWQCQCHHRVRRGF